MYPDLGLLVVRIVVGVVVMAHGLQKLGFLGGYGPQGTAQFMAGLGFVPGALWSWIVTIVEVVGGALILLGLLGPIGPVAVTADLVVAILAYHMPKGFWNSNGGYEYVSGVAAGAFAITTIGHGEWSLDGALNLTYSDQLLPVWAGAAAILAVVALAIRLTRAGQTAAG